MGTNVMKLKSCLKMISGILYSTSLRILCVKLCSLCSKKINANRKKLKGNTTQRTQRENTLYKFTQALKLPLLVMIFCLFTGRVMASDDNAIIAVLDGSKGQIKKDTLFSVSDLLMYDASYNSKLIKPYNTTGLVTLRINEDAGYELPDSFTVSLKVNIIFTRDTSNANAQDSVVNTTLTINYKSGDVYTSRNFLHIPNAYKIWVRVMDTLTISGTSLTATQRTNIAYSILLENELRPQRVYTFTSCSGSAITSFSSSDIKSDEVQILWSNRTGFDEYDLEWTYIDSFALAEGTYGSNPLSPDRDLIFANNSTRITTGDLSYSIPLIFPNAGTLFARVRPVQIKDGKRIAATWSSAFNRGLYRYDYSGHDNVRNWQSSISFAEEGKRKVVVQYFDGSLRSRQTVTKDNTTKTVVVAETFYDYQGRAAIQVLPSPTVNTVIGYIKNFNVAAGVNQPVEYDKSLYDGLSSPSEYCSKSAPAMDSTSGAAEYYSDENSLINNAHNKYIPDAEKYPFAETEYTQDNTGRIARQGGVGKAFQLNSGHETKYYYAITPDQQELDALFGTEAGDRTHYFKNLVKDANGQYSVSYVDMHGRTIATALAGESPANLSPLSSNITDSIKEVIADASTNTIKGWVIESQKSLMVTKDGTQRFTYSLAPPMLKKKSCNGDSVTYRCVYDLEIKITDDCNNQKMPDHKEFDTVFNRISFDPADISGTTSPVNIYFEKYLFEGNYQVVKKLSISEYAMDYYRDSVFMKKNTCKTYEDYVKYQLQLQQFGSCEPDCQSCFTSIGTWSSFRNNFMTNAGISPQDSSKYRTDAWNAYNDAIALCNSLCDSSIALNDDIRQRMLLDVSAPSGQYANPDAIDSYSIFYKPTGSTVPRYQDASLVYLDELGQKDSVYDDVTGKYLTPQQLSPQVFAQYFKTSWAETLLKFHPEYCKLLEYDKHASSLRWDKRFENVDTYAEAVSRGYLNPTANTTSSPFNLYKAVTANIDSLALEQGGIYKTRLEDSLKKFTQTKFTSTGAFTDVSMWALASSATRCAGSTSCMQDYVQYPSHCFDTTLWCTGDLDMAWRNFRMFYLQAKANIIYDLVKNASCSGYTNTSAQTLIDAGHYPAFIGAYDAGANTANPDTAILGDSIRTAMADYYNSNCKTYIEQWVSKLKQCPYYTETSIRNEIVPELLKVCAKGADTDHQMGSSSIAPDSSYTYKSFDEVISHYNSVHGISSVWSCSATLITDPKPYSAQTTYSVKPELQKPQDCECTRINKLHDEYLIMAESADTTFSAYLTRRYHTTMSQSNLDLLMSLCNGAETGCHYLQTAIQMPPLFQCNTSDICIDCNKFTQLKTEFTALYSVTPVKDETGNDSIAKVNNFFASFMNNKLGFSKQAWEYIDFMTRCQNAKVSYSKCESCDRLRTFVKGYFTGALSNNPLYISESGLYLYVKSKLQEDDGVIRDTASIRTALERCKSGWKDQVALSMRDGAREYVFRRKVDSTISPINTKITNLDAGADGHDFTIEVWVNNYGGHAYSTAFSEWRKKVPIFKYANTDFKYADTTRSDSWMNGFKGYSLVIDSARRVEFKLGDGSGKLSNGGGIWLRTTGTVSKLEWHNIVITRQGNYASGIKLYLDGQLANAEVVEGCDTLSSGDITVPQNDACGLLVNAINCDNGGSQTFEDGSYPNMVKNLRIYKRALASTEISANYYNCDGVPASQDSLTFWAKMDDGGYKAKDQSRFHADGNFQCASWDNNCPADTTNSRAWWGGRGPAACDSCLPKYDTALCYVAGATPDSLILCGQAIPVFSWEEEPEDITACSDSSFFATSVGGALYTIYEDSLMDSFDDDYISKCLEAAATEKFTVSHKNSEYHYTLYYYDLAGNLVKTIPPKGVNKITRQSWLDSVATARSNHTLLVPAHTLATQYRYNSLNQTVAQQSPDAGLAHTWYDRLGRPVLTQNAKQADNNQYSYTKYDALGRITEIGEITNNTAITTDKAKDPAQLQSWMNTGAATRTQITQTVYDEPYTPVATTIQQRNLRNRVSYMAVFDNTEKLESLKHSSATYFTYDIHGNVDTLIQDFTISSMSATNNRFFKKLVYKYDLISGKMNYVAYQPGVINEQFYHRYTYDAENRLTDVETSKDSLYWEHDAYYTYFKHGPLARMELGEQRVQGVDYAYTLQGWLKGVNSTASGSTHDMGADGYSTSSINSDVARDVFGFALYYYGDEDYKPIKTNRTPFADVPVISGSSSQPFKPLYNGNIACMVVNINAFGVNGSTGNIPHAYMYSYDQLNRLVGMNTVKNGSTSFSNNTWKKPALSNDYKEVINYDANGNILSYFRDSAGTTNPYMDKLRYEYFANSNKLNYVYDSVSTPNTAGDIEAQSANNYDYDKIGNLTKDNSEGISNIDWNVYGKIKKITKSGNKTITYTYDAAGNRLSKTVDGIETWYVRDGSGNVMCVYTVSNGEITLSEVNIYGSSRLGVYKPNINLSHPPAEVKVFTANGDSLTVHSFVRGQKFFELCNHLGNVLVIISDKKKGVFSSGVFQYYAADIASASDYYPFGMSMPGRTYNSAKSAYGFNGKRKDNEVYGEGNCYDYGFRIYCPPSGRFLSVDPLQMQYPMLTPYQFASNSPIQGADLDGREIYHYTLFFPSEGKPVLTYLGEQKNEMGTWPVDAIDRGKSEGFKTYNGATITTKSIQVHVVTGEGNGIAGVPPSVTFKYFKELIDWQAAGFPDYETYKAAAEARQAELEKGVFVATVTDPNSSCTTETGSAISEETTVVKSPQTQQASASGRQLTKTETEGIVGGTGTPNASNYRQVFFEAHPELNGKVVVHHSVEQQVLKRYPGLFTEEEINSLTNLRGIPLDKNSDLHLSLIRKDWNAFYKSNPNATKQQILDHAAEIDKTYGTQFTPQQ